MTDWIVDTVGQKVELSMSEVEKDEITVEMGADEVAYRPLIEYRKGYYVPISHAELNTLIGRLMQLCELNGDREQREALKAEIKMRTRSWLDEFYEISGYTNHRVDSGAHIVDILTGEKSVMGSTYPVQTKN